MDDKKNNLKINYEILVEESLRDVVKGALSFVEKNGLDESTHFYITFNTNHDGLKIDNLLLESNPDEMTIVLQHQFWDLIVEDKSFSVSLSFSGVKHSLLIPFEAITHFTDPSVGFGLQFSELGISEMSSNFETNKITSKKPLENKLDKKNEKNNPNKKTPKTNNHSQNKKNILETNKKEDKTAEIVSLDKFRKSPK